MQNTPPDLTTIPLHPMAPSTPPAFSAGHVMMDGQFVSLPQTPTIRQLVAEKPRRARIFEKHGIPYCCCSSGKPFWQACQEHNVNPQTVLDEIRLSDMQEIHPDEEMCQDWSLASSGDLRRHIVEQHHVFLRAELPRLSFLVDRVASEHGGLYPELWELQGSFEEFKTEIEWHIQREEVHLFHTLELHEQGTPITAACRANMEREICSLEQDHIYLLGALEKMKRLMDGFQVPPTACNTFRVMLESLKELTQDLEKHLREESEHLYPQALRLVTC